MTVTASVLVAAGQTLHRGLLSEALATGGFIVAAAAANTVQALDAAIAHNPDLALVDADLPSHDGQHLCAALKAACTARVLVLGHGDNHDQLRRAVEAGADGYIGRETALHTLFAAMRRVHDGEAVVPPTMLGTLLRDLIERNRHSDQVRELATRLTRREREVLELLVDGCDHLTVADILVISPQTARTHIQNVISKLGVHSRLEAVSLAVRHGLVGRLTAKGA